MAIRGKRHMDRTSSTLNPAWANGNLEPKPGVGGGQSVGDWEMSGIGQDSGYPDPTGFVLQMGPAIRHYLGGGKR